MSEPNMMIAKKSKATKIGFSVQFRATSSTYLNPSKKKGYVDVAFWVSAHLTKYNEHLISENRKVVKSLRYYQLEDINEEILLSVLAEAHQLKDKGFYKRK